MSAQKQAEPEAKNGGILDHIGSLLTALVGAAFAAYVFDFHGLQTRIDGLLGSFNHAAQARGGQLTSIFVVALPVAAVLIAGAILYILVSALSHALMAPIKEARKKKAKALVRQLQESADKAAGVIRPASTPMVLVRPTRLNIKEVGIAHIHAAK